MLPFVSVPVVSVPDDFPEASSGAAAERVMAATHRSQKPKSRTAARARLAAKVKALAASPLWGIGAVTATYTIWSDKSKKFSAVTVQSAHPGVRIQDAADILMAEDIRGMLAANPAADIVRILHQRHKYLSDACNKYADALSANPATVNALIHNLTLQAPRLKATRGSLPSASEDEDDSGNDDEQANRDGQEPFDVAASTSTGGDAPQDTQQPINLEARQQTAPPRSLPLRVVFTSGSRSVTLRSAECDMRTVLSTVRRVNFSGSGFGSIAVHEGRRSNPVASWTDDDLPRICPMEEGEQEVLYPIRASQSVASDVVQRLCALLGLS